MGAQGGEGLVNGAEEVFWADEVMKAGAFDDVKDAPFSFGEGEGDAAIAQVEENVTEFFLAGGINGIDAVCGDNHGAGTREAVEGVEQG